MPEDFEAEVLTALRELRGDVRDLREGVDRLDHALALVREDIGRLRDELREDLVVATTIATRTEAGLESDRAIVRRLATGHQELRRRVEKLEERDRGRDEAT
jgi:hypothetical protein